MLVRQAVSDLSRARRTADEPPVWLKLAKIIGATAISGADKRWLYSLQDAVIGAAATYTPQLNSNSITYDALSVSELSNNAVASYSYGVTKANLPAAFSAVRIPNGTYVVVTPHRCTDGSLVWLIINTQAIDGVCP
jgi:hypothetical protein